MRTRSILRIGVAVSVTIYSTSSVEVAVGRRRSRRVIRQGSSLPEPSDWRSDEQLKLGIPRSLGAGLETLKYGNSKGQHHIGYSGGKSKKGKGEGSYYSNDFPSDGKGSGKGYNNVNSGFSDDMARPSPTKPPISTPTKSPKSKRPTNQKKKHENSKSSKQKLKKSEKDSPKSRPIFQPTMVPTTAKLTPSPSSRSSLMPNQDSIKGSFSPYTILYTVTNDERPPFRSELLEVVELTRIYLDNYFSSYYEKSELTNLSKVMTLFTNTAFEFGEAVPIDYESKALFESSSVLLPDKKDLDNILVSAFEGDNLDGYIGLLQALPPSNMFSSSQYAKLVQMAEESPSIRSEAVSKSSIAKNLTLGSIVAGGVAGLILIFASSRRFRRQKYHERDKSTFGEKSPASIGGETFATRRSLQDDRMFKPICDELYSDTAENRR